jgi:hypothetical protein
MAVNDESFHKLLEEVISVSARSRKSPQMGSTPVPSEVKLQSRLPVSILFHEGIETSCNQNCIHLRPCHSMEASVQLRSQQPLSHTEVYRMWRRPRSYRGHRGEEEHKDTFHISIQMTHIERRGIAEGTCKESLPQALE